MIGLLVLGVLIGYLISVYKLARFIAGLAGAKGSIAKFSAIFLVLIALPFVDEIVGRFQFGHECRKAQGYTVSDSIESAKTLRYDRDHPSSEQLQAFIPITKITSRVIDIASGEVVLQFDTLHTPGGWVMRAGLNLGNFSSCNSVNDIKVLSDRGFKRIKGGFFERIAGR